MAAFDPVVAESAGQLFDLTGRTAIVTGAGDRLMSMAAIGLAQAGASVAVVDARMEHAQRVVDEITAAGGRAIALGCDPTSEAAIDATVAAHASAFGDGLDILVNGMSAGIERSTPEHLTADHWQSMIKVNVTAAFVFARAAGRRMIAAGRGGSIVNVASVAGVNAMGRGATHYGVAEASVLGLTRELAVAWGKHKIRVNAILPCQFADGASAQGAATDQAATIKRVVDGIPMGRLGLPGEIVGPILFLASDAASMVSGAALPVDGGNLALNAGGSVDW